MVVELIVFGESIGFQLVVSFRRIASPEDERCITASSRPDSYLKSATSLSTVSRSPEP